MTYEDMTGGWYPEMPRAYEKSIVLGGGLVLYPCPDPQAQAEVLAKFASDLTRRAYAAGKRDAKAEIRKALFG